MPVTNAYAKRSKAAEVYAATGSKLKAYREAGYAYAENANGRPLNWVYSGIDRLFKTPAMLACIERLATPTVTQTRLDRRLTKDAVIDSHLRLMALAEAKGDLATATANVTALGRVLGLYTDNLTVDTPSHRALSAAQAEYADRLTRLMIPDGVGPAALPILDSQDALGSTICPEGRSTVDAMVKVDCGANPSPADAAGIDAVRLEPADACEQVIAQVQREAQHE